MSILRPPICPGLLPFFVVTVLCGCGPRVETGSTTATEWGSTTGIESGSTTGIERIGGGIDVPMPGRRNAIRPSRAKQPVSQLSTLKDPDRRLVEISTILAYRTGHPDLTHSESDSETQKWWEAEQAKSALNEIEQLGFQVIKNRVESSRSDQELTIGCTSWWTPPKRSEIPDIAGKLSEAIPAFNELGQAMEDLRAVGIHPKVTLYFYDPKQDLTAAMKVLHEVDIPVQISVWYYDFTEANCSAIAGLPTVESLFTYHTSINTQGVTQLATSQSLRRLDCSFHAPQQRAIDWSPLANMSHLEELELAVKDDADAFLETISKLAHLRTLRLSGDQVSETALTNFMTNGDRSLLKELSVNSELCDTNFPNELKHAPNLRKLSLSMHHGWVDYLIERLTRTNRQMQELEIQIGRDQGIDTGKTDGILVSLTRLPDLEIVSIPLRLERSSQLEPLVRLQNLKSFHFANFINLDREAVLHLSCLPKLNGLNINKLNIDQSCAHMIPWFSQLKAIHVDDGETFTTESIQQLARFPALESLTYWNTPSSRRVSFAPLQHLDITDYD